MFFADNLKIESISLFVKSDLTANIRATVPVTYGAANEVPDEFKQGWFLDFRNQRAIGC